MTLYFLVGDVAFPRVWSTASFTPRAIWFWYGVRSSSRWLRMVVVVGPMCLTNTGRPLPKICLEGWRDWEGQRHCDWTPVASDNDAAFQKQRDQMFNIGTDGDWRTALSLQNQRWRLGSSKQLINALIQWGRDKCQPFYIWHFQIDCPQLFPNVTESFWQMFN